ETFKWISSTTLSRYAVMPTPNEKQEKHQRRWSAETRDRKKHLNIIGISAGYHDSACCLMRDGVLVAAAQEERFSRIKHDKSFPRMAFRYCLKQGGINISDIDSIAYYEDPAQKLGRQIWMGLIPKLSLSRQEALIDRLMRPQPEEFIRKLFGYEGP